MILHEWAIRGDVPGVLEELEGGVFVDVKEMTSGHTALELACAQPETSTEMLRLLINAGAKASLGMKAAVAMGSIGTVAQLLSLGVGIDEVDDDGQYGSLIHAAYGRSQRGDTTLIPMLMLAFAAPDTTRARIVSRSGTGNASSPITTCPTTLTAMPWN